MSERAQALRDAAKAVEAKMRAAERSEESKQGVPLGIRAARSGAIAESRLAAVAAINVLLLETLKNQATGSAVK